MADYRASELSMREWCEKNGVTDHQLRYWLAKTGSRPQAGTWVCVELVDDGATPSDGGLAIHVGVARIEVRPGFDPTLRCEALRVVASTC